MLCDRDAGANPQVPPDAWRCTWMTRFGVVERRDLLELVGATELTDEQTQLLKDGMQLLVGYLGAVRAGWDDEDAPIH